MRVSNRRPARRLTWLAAAAIVGPTLAAMPVEAAPGVRNREVRAQLIPRRYTTISAEIGARINRIHVPEGGAFRAGQPLVSFDCSLQAAQLRKSQAELAGAEKTFAANRRLKELNSVGSIEVETSQAAARRAAADVDMSRTLLSKCRIAAPFSGRIAEQRVREQQFAQPGQPLLEIIDDSSLELDFLAPSRWLPGLKPGARFTVRIDETGRTYPAAVVRTGARIDPVSQSIKVKGVIVGRFPELLAGMSGVVALPAARTN